MSDGAVEGGQNQKKYIRRTSKSDIGLSGRYQKDVLNIRPRHLSDIRRTALCYVGHGEYFSSLRKKVPEIVPRRVCY
ncbi:Uncharacterized protein APZ42_002808 [Daphnia magna]|uniref:Uncharacterized protein n=1 Tax=Daphnia magna TaxID=35525 RepID=A0A162CXZ5_9CRUS|nr:Uncharacterized protein APZ42_002808 [Daphnia magna]